MKKCDLCSHIIASGKNQCPSCGHWNFASGTLTDGHDKSKDGSLLFEDIDSSTVERVPTGIIDECLGGGLVRSDVILIGGGPGAGKSTLMLQIASELCKHGSVMYIAAEEDIRTIKTRGERLRIETRRQLRMVPALSGVANIGALLWAYRPGFIIADSIDALSGSNDGLELVILSVMKKFCVELSAPAMVISQVNKGGDYAGLKAKQHAVDVLLTFDADESDPDDETGDYVRHMETIKNRSGRAGVIQSYRMTPVGLDPIPDSDD